MSDFQSTVIIDINLSQADAREKAQALTKAIADLNAQQVLLTSNGQKGSVQFRDNALALQTLQQETKAYINLSNNADGSINTTRAQIALLTNQYNALSKSERDGTAAGKLLQQQLKNLSDEERNATQAAGNFKSTIGNYRQEIVRAGQDLLPFGSQINRVVNSLNSMKGVFEGLSGSIGTFGTALAASGIGLAILAVGALTSYLKDLDTVVDTSEQLFAGFKGVLGELGRSILSLNFKDLQQRLIEAGTNAAFIKEVYQDLEDSLLIQSVKSADAQAEVAKKRAEALNRALDPKVREQLLADAEKIDAKDLEQKKALADKGLQIAQESIAFTGKLNQQEIQQLKDQGVKYALELQNNRVTTGKVTAEQTKALADSYLQITRIEDEYTQRAERRNNLAERIALQAEAKEKERQQHLYEIALDRLKSELAISASMLTVREKEYADINYDIDKRKKLYIKYGADTTLLEKERVARIGALDAQFRKEELDAITKNIREILNLRMQFSTGGLTNPKASSKEQGQALQNQFDIEDIDKQIEAVAARIALGERDLGNLLDSLINLRIAKEKAGNFKLDELNAENERDRMASLEKAKDEELAFQNQALDQEFEINSRRMKMNEQVLGSYENLFGTIHGLVKKNSALSIAAFALEQAFAIGKIIINAAQQESEIGLAASKEASYWADIPYVGWAVAAGIYAAAAVEEGAVAAEAALQVASIAAQSIGEFTSGFSRGGYVNGPGNGTSDSIPARLSNGEFVMTAQATKMFAPIISDMNVAGGGKPFATGGLAGTYVPTLTDQINADNAITRSIMAGIGGMRPVVYVEDINYGQHKMDVTVEAGNF